MLLWIYLSLVSVIDILYASLNLFFNKSHSMFVWRIRSIRFLVWRPDLVIVITAGLSIFISLLVLMWHYNTSCCYSFPFRHTLTYKYWTHDYDNRYCCSFCWLSINQPNNVIQQCCIINWIKSLEFTFFSFSIPIYQLTIDIFFIANRRKIREFFLLLVQFIPILKCYSCW